jgi:hypothetical protein
MQVGELHLIVYIRMTEMRERFGLDASDKWVFLVLFMRRDNGWSVDSRIGWD